MQNKKKKNDRTTGKTRHLKMKMIEIRIMVSLHSPSAPSIAINGMHVALNLTANNHQHQVITLHLTVRSICLLWQLVGCEVQLVLRLNV